MLTFTVASWPPRSQSSTTESVFQHIGVRPQSVASCSDALQMVSVCPWPGNADDSNGKFENVHSTKEICSLPKRLPEIRSRRQQNVRRSRRRSLKQNSKSGPLGTSGSQHRRLRATKLCGSTFQMLLMTNTTQQSVMRTATNSTPICSLQSGDLIESAA